MTGTDRICGIFCGEKILRISRFRKNYTQKTKKLYGSHLIFDICEILTPQNIPPIRYMVSLYTFLLVLRFISYLLVDVECLDFGLYEANSTQKEVIINLLPYKAIDINNDTN